MFNPRTALVLVVPLACAALVACGASVGEDVRVTGEAEEPAASSEPTSPSSASPSPSDPMLAEAPVGAANQPSGGAGSEDAPIDAGAPDAYPDAQPRLSCASATMATAAPSPTCLPMTAPTLTGGTFYTGTYYLTQWSDAKATCASTTSKQQGTMTIEEFEGRLYSRWTLSRDGKTWSGIDRLDQLEDPTTVARAPVCSKLLTRDTKVARYKASAFQIVFDDAGGQQTWARPQKAELPTVPTTPIVTL